MAFDQPGPPDNFPGDKFSGGVVRCVNMAYKNIEKKNTPGKMAAENTGWRPISGVLTTALKGEIGGYKEGALLAKGSQLAREQVRRQAQQPGGVKKTQWGCARVWVA